MVLRCFVCANFVEQVSGWRGAPPTWKLYLCETLVADENGGPQTFERCWKTLVILSVSPRPRTAVSCLGSKAF